MQKHGFRLTGLLLLLGLSLTPMHALAAGEAGKDCPFVGSLDSFAPSRDLDWTSYTQLDFRTADGKVTKFGKLCYQQYNLKPGQQKMSGLEIMSNYAQAMAAAGAQITNTKRADDDDIYATLTKDGAEYWFYIWEGNGDAVGVKVLQVAPFKYSMLPPSGNDYAPLGHLPQSSARAPSRQITMRWRSACNPATRPRSSRFAATTTN